MSVYGTWTAATIASGAKSSSAVNLEREWDYLDLQIPGMKPCKLSLQVAETLGGNYYDLGKDVTTDEGNFDRADVWKLGGYQYIKIVSSKEQPSSVLIRVRGMRY